MGKRRTRCITFGEMRTGGEPLLGADGRRVGHISFALYVTACGKEVETDADLLWDLPPARAGARPIGVCPRCWPAFTAANTAAAELSILEGLGLSPCPD